jgi:hypothetical protein
MDKVQYEVQAANGADLRLRCSLSSRRKSPTSGKPDAGLLETCSFCGTLLLEFVEGEVDAAKPAVATALIDTRSLKLDYRTEYRGMLRRLADELAGLVADDRASASPSAGPRRRSGNWWRATRAAKSRPGTRCGLRPAWSRWRSACWWRASRATWTRRRTGSSSSPERQAGGSWTRRLHPDYTLTFWPEGLTEAEAERRELLAHVHFDAKCRVEDIEELFGADDADDADEEADGNYKGRTRSKCTPTATPSSARRARMCCIRAA